MEESIFCLGNEAEAVVGASVFRHFFLAMTENADAFFGGKLDSEHSAQNSIKFEKKKKLSYTKICECSIRLCTVWFKDHEPSGLRVK